MNFIKGFSLGREIESFPITNAMVLRRINDDNLCYEYELKTENDEIIYFGSMSKARVGDRVTRSPLTPGKLLLLRKEAYEQRFLELDPDLIVHVGDDKNYVTVSLPKEHHIGELRMLCMIEKNAVNGEWIIKQGFSLTDLNIGEARVIMTAHEMMMRAVLEIEPGAANV